MRLRQPGGGLHLGICRLRPADADIVGDAAVEDGAVLEDDADMAAQALQRDIADIGAVGPDAAR